MVPLQGQYINLSASSWQGITSKTTPFTPDGADLANCSESSWRCAGEEHLDSQDRASPVSPAA